MHSDSDSRPSAATGNEEALLQLIRQLMDELHPDMRLSGPLTLDSSLDRDLGLDSLARVELLARLEQQFDLSLSEYVLAMAETPRDLLLHFGAGRQSAPAPPVMQPFSFLARPERWLWAIHNHRGTLSASPSFGYEFCCRRIDDNKLKGLDLSSWRLAFNGAEPVSPETITSFADRFAPYGFRPEAASPVYGLAESSVGLAFPPLGRGPVIDRVNRSVLLESGRAVAAPEDDPSLLKFVASGRPLAGHQIRIVDESGRELPDRHQGELQFKGPSVTSGYYRDPEKTHSLFTGEWLNSGDLAYIAEGDIFITSRIKDIIIRGGRNIYPHELEEAVGSIEGVRKGCVAVFATRDQDSSTERLIVLAESRKRDPETKDALHRQIVNISVDLLCMPPDEVVIAPPGTVLKTSSGKIRRAASRELYEKGEIGKAKRALWLQLVRLSVAGILPQTRRIIRRTTAYLYASYCWLLFFAEGTLQRMPGLLPFQMGAFVSAAQAGIPVLPLTLRGTRNKLRGGSWFPRTGAVSLLVGQPVMPTGKDWNAAVRLRDQVRSEILSHCGEPDLAGVYSSISQMDIPRR